MMNTKRALATLGTLAITATPLTAQPAQASPLCSDLGICGKIRVPSDARWGGVVVGCNWDPYGDGQQVAAPAYRVAPGETSRVHCGKDTDGVWVPAGKEVWVRGFRVWEKWADRTGWHKYRDSEGTKTLKYKRD